MVVKLAALDGRYLFKNSWIDDSISTKFNQSEKNRIRSRTREYGGSRPKHLDCFNILIVNIQEQPKKKKIRVNLFLYIRNLYINSLMEIF